MPSSASDAETAVAYLRSPLAIRARCENVLEAGVAGRLAHFAVDLGKLASVVDELIAAARPPRASRNAELDSLLEAQPPDERARAWIDLVVVTEFGNATYEAFKTGRYSSDPNSPLRVDAARLASDEPDPTLRALGDALLAAPMIFPGERPGGLLDHLVWIVLDKRVPGGSAMRRMVTKIDAPSILSALLDGLSAMWPGPIELGGVNLGDVGRHPAAGGTGPSAGLVPFHASAQWLAYSLFEPVAMAGLEITHSGALTGLPDKRTVKRLVDHGVLVPRSSDEGAGVHDELTVEWRALTVALMDRVVEAMRRKLGKSPAELPLASILELSAPPLW